MMQDDLTAYGRPMSWADVMKQTTAAERCDQGSASDAHARR